MGQNMKIKDTGKDEVDGTILYAKVDYGSDGWVPLPGFRLNGEFNVFTTSNDSYKTTDLQVSGQSLDFPRNSISSIKSPRFTFMGYVKVDDAPDILNKLILMSRTKGVKRLSGGLGMISSLPEVRVDTYNYISVIIKNVAASEVAGDSEDYIKITVQCEQV